jgi:6-pyruvoyltetrahydropterin/6-carboxytetrahydropterin synthase
VTASITVRHNAEAAHRLPLLGGKCTNLHGHSWLIEVTIYGAVDADGVLIEFATAKRIIRDWIDTHLDHGAMLGADDPLVPVLREQGCRVFVFDPADTAGPCAAGAYGITDRRALPWPTVENVAELVRRVVIAEVLGGVGIVDVTVTETAVNAATARTLL